MRHTLIGFTAPSTIYPGATISLQCNRYFDGEAPTAVAWAMNVFAEGGDWVKHPDSDVLEDNTDDMLRRLSSFYDGTSDWSVDGTSENLTFWQMRLGLS
jgi:hypothetical protein